MKSSAPRLLLPGLCIFLLGIMVARLPVLITYVRGSIGTEDWDRAVREVHALISERYVEKPDAQALLRGAIDGMTRTLNDPFTEFIPPAEAAAFEKEITGRFVGIGATITIEDGWLTIVSPIEDSPAIKAGLRAGDRIVEVEGQSTKGLSSEGAVKKLTGEPDTVVHLTIERAGARLPVSITRRPVAARSVSGFFFDDGRQAWNFLIDPANRIAYIRMSQFTDTCADELVAAIDQAERSIGASGGTGRLSGIVLDLRDNPGGVLEQAVAIADLFLEKGTIVSTKGRPGVRKNETFAARPGGITDVSLVVLVSAASASASEVLAGALQDNNRAVVVGTRTFGKGLVQAIEGLESLPNGYLKITEQRYYLPSGRMIHRTDDAETWGVDPSPGFYVPLTDAEQRDALRARRAMETARPRGAPLPPGMPDQLTAKWYSPDWLVETLKDRQLGAALKAVQLKVAEGDWKPTGEPLPAGAQQASSIATRELKRLDVLRERLLRDLNAVDSRIATLESAAGAKAGDAAAQRPDDLWPDATDLTGGRIEVFDPTGQRVALLDITGPDVERWLLDAEVRPRGWKPPVTAGAQLAKGAASGDNPALNGPQGKAP